MASVNLCRLRFVLLLLLFAFLPRATFAEGWQAGTARTRITPSQLIWMAGYAGRDHPAEGKLTELWAKALALQDAEGHRGVLITLDLVGIHRDTTNKICSRLRNEHGLTRSQIGINCSHTHTGPVAGQNLAPLHYLQLAEAHRKQIDDYEKALVDKVVATVTAAIGDLEPGSLTWGNGLCTVAVNRRNNPAAEVPERRVLGTLRGPYDHAVPVLAVRDSRQQLKTILFGYACHATVLSSYQWSGDYPGYAQIEVERRFPTANAMFWAGCGADQNPLPRRTMELARSYGNRLATSVGEVIEGTMHSVEPSLHSYFDEIDLPLVDLPTRAELQETLHSSEKFERGRAEYLLQHMENQAQPDATYPYPVATWRIGSEVRFVLLGGEVVVDYALRLKTEAAIEDNSASSEMIWVAGYSNDVMAYIPSRRVLREGGYEGGGSNRYYGLPGLWSPQIENLIINTAIRQLNHPVGDSSSASH